MLRTSALLLVALALAPAREDERALEYGRDIRPILADRCFVCHGPDERANESGLRLDDEASAKADLGGYRAIDVAAPDDSELLYRIRGEDPDLVMPPAGSNLTLTAEEVALLERWIAEGAEYEPHWAFTAVERPEVPQVADAGWARDELDRFVLARLEAEGARPAPEVERALWLRRASLDLTGLPPTTAELEAFEADAGPDAYERQVDRLLASPHFGEQRAVAWLDLARYADTYGYQNDRYRDVWPWRDWVVRAFNENLPFDEFATWQIAGDLLPETTPDQQLATAFQRLHRQTNEGGSVEEEFRIEYVSDRVHTFGTAFLGLTLECARCHDHKFDPISQREYYALSSYFASIDESGLYSHFTDATPTPALGLPTDEQRARLATLTEEVAAAERALAAARAEADPGEPVALQGPLEGVFQLDADAALSGDDGRGFRGTGVFRRWEPFTIALRIRLPEAYERAVVLHRSRAWTDAASQGYEWLIEDGRWSAALIHFWPGDAIRVRTRDALPTGAWLHLCATYDGSSRADGLRLYVDGAAVETEVVRDHLTRRIDGGGDLTLTIGERFRDRGLRGAHVSELAVVARDLEPAQVELLAGGADPGGLPDPLAADARAAVLAARRALGELRDAIPQIMAMRELPEPRPVHLLARGRYDAPTEELARAVPAVLALGGDAPRDRLELARWLFDPAHPLTARVAVNRVWQELFGAGLVESAENFGLQGTSPSDPELLDHLAATYAESGWDTKALYRRVVLSATYRRAATGAGGVAPRRLSAEMVRDAALFASGLLDATLGGPPAHPYQPPGLWQEKSGQRYPEGRGGALWRRSLYTIWKRTSPPPSMRLFDAAKRDVCIARRQSTNTPLQALVLWNDPQFVEAARVLATRLCAQHADGPAAVADAFRALCAREATAGELEALVALERDERAAYTAAPDAARALLAVGRHPAPEGADAVRIAALATVVQAILSSDAFLTVR